MPSISLQQMIATTEALGQLAERAGPIIARAVEAELRRTIAAGTDPYGVPWKLTQAGDVPLRNAIKAVSVAAVGRTVWVRIDDEPEARHHLGAARGKIRRRIIPSKKQLPKPMALAIQRALEVWVTKEVLHG